MVVALCNVHSSIIALTLLLKETVICNIGDREVGGLKRTLVLCTVHK